MVRYTYFCSGANREAEYVGLSQAGINYGVSLKDLHTRRIPDILARAADVPKVQVFVDSGAFGEVHYAKDGTRSIVAPISHEQWLEKLDTYDQFATAYGNRVTVVAPDCVGDQVETLQRLSRYVARVLSLLQRCNVIVPLQVGEMSLEAMYRETIAILGTDRFVVGIPSKKGATPLAELEQFLRAVKPRAIHLLGMSPCSVRWGEVRTILEELPRPPKHIAMDAVRLRALVQRARYLGPLTERMDHYTSQGCNPREAKIRAIADLKPIILKEYPRADMPLGASDDEQPLLPWKQWPF